eukprot:scpid74447/ scgid21249/ 
MGKGSRINLLFTETSSRRKALAICAAAAAVIIFMVLAFSVSNLSQTWTVLHRISPGSGITQGEASLPSLLQTESPRHGRLRLPTQSMFFLYLVVGKAHPSVQWRKLSRHANVFVMFSSWQDDVTAQYEDAYHLAVIYYPNSTWTSARNYLYSQVSELEKEQTIKFDYIMFADEDIRMTYTNTQEAKVEKYLKGTVQALLHLQDILQRDKPARASAEYANDPKYPIEKFSARCVQACSFDGLLDIYHRTIAEFLLPYETKFEEWNWHISMYIMNLRTRALAEPYCNLYREVFVDTSTNDHNGAYPRDYSYMKGAFYYAAACVHRAKLSLSTRRNETVEETSLKALFRPPPNSSPKNCTTIPGAGVDYSHLLAEKLTTWPKRCKVQD